MAKVSIDNQELAAYYGDADREFGFESKCKMVMPLDVRDARVLDVGCRRGKGVYQLSEMAGEKGFVVGIDPTPQWIEEAKAGIERALGKSGLDVCNMEFAVGYPEATGMDDNAFDVVYVNSSFNMARDLQAALAEFERVLRRGGALVLDTVVADGARDAETVAAARAIGNAVQAAPSNVELTVMLAKAGYGTIECTPEGPVAANEGFAEGETVPVAQPDDGATFTKTVIVARKR